MESPRVWDVDPIYRTRWRSQCFNARLGNPSTNDALNDAGKPLRGSKVLLVGLAYKANVDDDRESPGYVLLDKMKEKGCQVRYYDPYIPVIRPSRNHAHWGGTRCVGWDRETISEFDAVLIATAHQNVNYDQLGQWAKLIVDTRNAMQGRESLGTVVKA